MTDKFKPNRRGYIEIMNSQEVQGVLSSKADQVKSVAESCGSATYASNVQPGKVRAHAIVYTPSEHAMYSNAKHNSLLKGINGIGGG